MKRSEKKNILDLTENMRVLHKMLADSGEDLLMDYLSTCQQAAISVGDILEKDSPDGLQDMISTLEQYAECCYEITVRGECTADDIKQLDNLIDAAAEKIEKLSVKIQVVFFPYKAEMWDSLESIYLAAAADPDCEVKVIPIPYYEMDQTMGKWVLKYDGGHFPLGIPIEFYKDYDVKTEQPDIAYIHNPYDNYNLVTSVHPDYYSFELKKYVGKLVYVPYYVNAGKLSKEHKNLPCYQHVDYIVLQSKQAKEGFRGSYCYDKILPLGSPKIDRVIRKCKEGVSVPESWEKVIDGRRTLMLNSSLGELLVHNEKIFIKLKNFFEYINNDKKIAIIWRPHPLYEATIRSMRPELLQQYTELKNFFVDNGIGVLDTTPDISSTVAVADGYIGSSGSSVINLFGAAGKPIFRFDNSVTEIAAEEESRIFSFDAGACIGDKFFAYSHYPDYLFEICMQDCVDTNNPPDNSGVAQVKIKPVTDISKNRLYAYPYWLMTAMNGKLYFSPTAVPELAQYDPEKNEITHIHTNISSADISFCGVIACEDSLFLITGGRDLIAEYSTRKHKWIYHSRGPECLFENSGMDQNAAILWGIPYKKTIYFFTGATNRILGIHSGTGKFEIVELGAPSVTSGMSVYLLGASGEGLWLEVLSNAYRRSDAAGIYLAQWEHLGDVKSWKYFPLLFGKQNRYEDMEPLRFFSWAVEIDGYMVVCPNREKHIFRIDSRSGEVSFLAEGFWEALPEEKFSADKGGEVAKNVGISEKHILIQRCADKRMALIHVAGNTYTEFIPQLSEDDFKTVLKKNEGFGKNDYYGYFAMTESDVYSVRHFLNQFAESGWGEIKERQMKALESFAANLDGSCGEKVHETVMRDIKQ